MKEEELRAAAAAFERLDFAREAKQEHREEMRIATLNVRGFQTHAHRIFELLKERDVDLVAIQEAMTTEMNWPTVKATAKQKGWKAFRGAFNMTRAGASRPYGGNIVLSKWPIFALKVPENLRGAERVQLVAVHRPGGPPFILANVHMPHTDEEKMHMMQDLMAYLASFERNYVIIGDFNMEPDERIVAGLLAREEHYLWDGIEDRGPTRWDQQSPGRHIDYAISTLGLHKQARWQDRGVADHDMITYAAKMSVPKKMRKWNAVRKIDLNLGDSDNEEMSQEVELSDNLDPPDPVQRINGEPTEMEVEAAFAEIIYDFEEAERRGDIDRMWKLASDLAEDLLSSEYKGKRRSAIPSTFVERDEEQVQRRPASKKSMALRRLHKIRGIISDLRVKPEEQTGWHSFRKQKRLLADRYPEIEDFNPMLDSTRDKVDAIIKEREDEERVRRIHKWKERMEDGMALTAWVTREDNHEEADDIPKWIHPQEVVDAERQKYNDLFNEEPANLDNLDKTMSGAGIGRAEGAPANPRVCIDGERLWKRAREQRKKAGGADGWKPGEFALLPKRWFQIYARVWNTCLKCGKVPEVWKNIRMIGIPKHDGTGAKRGLGIAPYAWRLGMTGLIRQHRSWIATWLDEGIASGPQRGVEDLLDVLLADCEEAEEVGEPFMGVKIDLSKYFDRCTPERSLRMIDQIGMSSEITEVIRDFYRGVKIYVEYEGVVSKEPVRPGRGLLQGCPASVLLAIVEQHGWIRFVKNRVPGVNIAAYVDDRTIWARGKGGIDQIEKAVTAAKLYDDLAGLVWNEGKGAAWCSTKMEAEELLNRDLKAGDLKPEVDVLGVTMRVTNRSDKEEAKLRRRAWDKAKTQCKRIAIAVQAGSNPVRERRRLVQKLITPKLVWSGQYQAASEEEIMKMDRLVADTVNDAGSFCSPALARMAAGAEVMPSFGIDYQVIRHERWRNKRRREERKVGSKGTRESRVLEKWKWKKEGNGLYATERGTLDLGRDGRASIKFVAEEAWRKSLWRIDERASDNVSLEMILENQPIIDEHLVWARGSNRKKRRIALGDAKDYRVATFYDRVYGKCDDPWCMCGEPVAERRHWMWECDAIKCPTKTSNHNGPRCQVEEALAVRLSPLPEKAAKRKIQRDTRVEDELLRAFQKHQRRIEVASDGGVKQPRNPRMRTGGWGVFVEDSQDGRGSGGPVLGIDQTSFAAELAGASVALRAAAQTQIPIRLWVDNLAVQKGVQRRIKGARPKEQFYDKAWGDVEDIISRLPEGCDCVWVPSHNKKRDEWEGPEWARELNQKADDEATEISEAMYARMRVPEKKAEDAAKTWAKMKLLRLYRGEELYKDKWVASKQKRRRQQPEDCDDPSPAGGGMVSREAPGETERRSALEPACGARLPNRFMRPNKRVKERRKKGKVKRNAKKKQKAEGRPTLTAYKRRILARAGRGAAALGQAGKDAVKASDGRKKRRLR